MKVKIVLILGLLCGQLCNATNYFVSNSGSNSNNGLTTTTAFLTVTYTATVANHGDTILVMPGIYTNATYGTWDIWKTEQTVRISNKVGTTGSYLIIKPQVAGTVKFRCDGNFIFQVRNSSYIRVEGFELEGERDNISLNTALQYQFTYKDSNDNIQERVPPGAPAATVATMTFPILTGTTRPSVLNMDALIAQNSDHIDFVNNIITKSTSAGIRIGGCDYVNIIGNTVSDCNQRTSVGTPAVVFSLINSIDTNNGVKIFVSQNKVYNNFNLVYSWNAAKDFIVPLIDEGKGISVEHCITRVSPNPSWDYGRIRIENNICYNNGFSGINTNEAERVDVINNTCYQNIASGRGANTGISINDTNDANVFNNISWSINNFGGDALSIRTSTNTAFSNNLVNGTIDADVDLIDVNTIFANPLFVDAINFRLTSGSQAINSSINSVAPSVDFYGNTRDANKDRGAVEYIPLANNEFETNNKIVIYPNPVADSFKIQNIENISNITIYDVKGAVVKSIKTSFDASIDISDLTKGMYLLKIMDANGKIYIDKLVK